jgi:hypothetical protein
VEEIMEVTPVSELFQRERRDLIIPRSQEITLSPEQAEFRPFFHLVEIRTFSDLQVLSLVPQGLAEDLVRTAIAADDDESWAFANSVLQAHGQQCRCVGAAGSAQLAPKRSFRREVAAVQRAVRKAHNSHLAQVMSTVQRTRFRPDDMHPAIVHRWVSHLEVAQALSIVVALASDLVIQHNATLHVSGATTALYAANIRIHVGGKLRIHGSYKKIVASGNVQGELP